MDTSDARREYEQSLERQAALIRGSIVLNPVENFPFEEDIKPVAGVLHGLYNTDKIRTNDQKSITKIQFSNRDRLAYDSRKIYGAWARALDAADVSMRLLSGLHAHTVFFMSVTKPGDCVLLLPEKAGGHMSTKSILERLGLKVIELAIDLENLCIDLPRTLSKIKETPPAIVFIDRSEGLFYEDFSELMSAIDAPKLFDASQYLSNILAGHHRNPFDMGFDYIIATVHKNFPGPQKALVAARCKTELWSKLLTGISTYVSNMHTFSTYAAGLTLARHDWLFDYSSRMLLNTIELDQQLGSLGLPIVARPGNLPPTHHIWLQAANQEQAFKWFTSLESTRINANFRKLPYDLGYGLRLGLSATTRLGLTPADCALLAELIADSISVGNNSNQRRRVRAFAEDLWQRGMQ